MNWFLDIGQGTMILLSIICAIIALITVFKVDHCNKKINAGITLIILIGGMLFATANTMKISDELYEALDETNINLPDQSGSIGLSICGNILDSNNQICKEYLHWKINSFKYEIERQMSNGAKIKNILENNE
ncbi:Uncharacterised protein [Campylobacter hyointestinalis subsp. hyointestinalis]|uniref:Uncharacterized protein n=1 Tax=Campylobacter hyointestinalis subsp. hyointestinalis TaxID=91352 RepID=A0A0S4STS7_CAMHY|nr:hypothetical protein [Campylobacter hyointestinalis]CUU89874.1 Uncharacterised protein [Campylobacter hyointestinalis subsp. hyointestinalis]